MHIAPILASNLLPSSQLDDDGDFFSEITTGTQCYTLFLSLAFPFFLYLFCFTNYFFTYSSSSKFLHSFTICNSRCAFISFAIIYNSSSALSSLMLQTHIAKHEYVVEKL
jgi:hypothetical protein